MNVRNSTAALLLAGLLSAPFGAALAQSGWAEVPDSTMIKAFGMSADDLDDLDVVNAAGHKIGEVEDVLSEVGQPAALGIEFEGFSDYSPGKDLDVIVPFDQFTLEQGRLKLNADAAAVKAMETYPD